VYDGFAEAFQPRVEEIDGTFGLKYAGVIRSTPTHTRVVCTAGPLAETYVKGARGTKSVNEGCHEAYDFETGDPSVVDTLRDLRDDIEADIESHFG